MEELLNKVKTYCKERSAKSREEFKESIKTYCKEQSAKSRGEVKESTNRGFNTGYCLGYAHALESVADMLDGKEIVKRA